MRIPLVAANWKMHGSLVSVASYLKDLQVAAGVEAVVFPPAVYLAEFVRLQTGISCGSQDIGEFADGAHTGELAASMIADVGGSWTLAGHSERRLEHSESSELVARKVAAALVAGLKPLLCIGETLEEREAGREQEVVARQLDAISGAGGSDDLMQRLMEHGAIGYEPVWAIGTGQTATPGQAQDMHAFIRGHLAQTDAAAAEKVRIVYGGSVKPDNAGELFGQADIDGGLVGGASLDASQFSQIIGAANA